MPCCFVLVFLQNMWGEFWWNLWKALRYCGDLPQLCWARCSCDASSVLVQLQQFSDSHQMNCWLMDCVVCVYSVVTLISYYAKCFVVVMSLSSAASEGSGVRDGDKYPWRNPTCVNYKTLTCFSRIIGLGVSRLLTVDWLFAVHRRLVLIMLTLSVNLCTMRFCTCSCSDIP